MNEPEIILMNHPLAIPVFFGSAVSALEYNRLLEDAPVAKGRSPFVKDPKERERPEYTSRHGILYRETPQGPRRVLKKSHALDVMQSCHAGNSGAHFRIGATT